ncbi:DUF6188 family protein [Kitasatospora sp. NPDC050463]|uniref:DUF6188 family protein n=1 Tax=Kitasatospora sp. NPDC050463 TaxID=3155786 RepID=UPI0033FEE88F
MENGIADVLTGRRVTSVSGGGRLDLTLDGPVTVRVTHEFRLAMPSEVEHFYPALTFRPTGPLLALAGRTVETARVTPAGGLELAFEGGAALSVRPHALVAPWSVFTPEGVVCSGLAGGEVTWANGPGH